MNDDGTRTTYLVSQVSSGPTRGTCLQPEAHRRGGRPGRAGPGAGRTARAPTSARWHSARNLLAAFMPWEGHNYEDAIILFPAPSSRMTCSGSIHIEEHEGRRARQPSWARREITRDIPNVSDEGPGPTWTSAASSRIGAEVVKHGGHPGRQGHPEGPRPSLTPEERLLARRSSARRPARVRDTSLKVPHGEEGKVIGVRVFTREDGDEPAARR